VKLLSILSDADNSRRAGDPRAAHKHFDRAFKVVDTIKHKSKNRSELLDELILEQYLNIWTGLTQCNLDIINQAPTPLSETQKKIYLKKAKHHADNAYVVHKKLHPGSSTCDARDLIEKQEG
jgi:hypothetical protein